MTARTSAFSRDPKGSAFLEFGAPLQIHCESTKERDHEETGQTGGSACRRTSSRRGMTLVEVLVASVLLGVGVAGLIFSATLGMRNQQRSEQRMAALYLAQEKLAAIEVVGPRFWSLAEPSRGTETRGNVAFEWSVQIEAMTEGELFDVKAEVSWLGPGGGGEVELETLLNDYEAAAMTAAGQDERESPVEANRPPAD